MFGSGTLAIHVTSAAIGIVTIPAVYLAAEALFSEEGGLLTRYGGLLSALVVALSYWHLNWSRYGVRAILVPLFAAMTVSLLWRGLRTGNRWSIVGCGLTLGASAYTYQAARLLPLLVLLGFAYVALSHRSFTKNDALNLGIIILAAATVFAPLGYHFATHPGSFGGRAGQAFVLSDPSHAASGARALFNQVADTFLMFGIRGDSEPFSTIPGRPVLNPFLFAACCLGIAISLWRFRKPSHLLLLTWLALMSVPGMLATYGPTAKRAIGALPAVAMLIAVGLLAACDLVRRIKISPRVMNLVLVVATSCGLVYTAALTYRDYFVTWARNPALFTHFEVGLSAIGQYVGQLPADERVYISPPSVEHPGIMLHSGRRQDLKGYNGRACIVLPDAAPENTTYVVIPGEDGNSLDELALRFPHGAIVAQGPLHFGEPYFLAYSVPAGTKAQVTPQQQLSVNWDNQIELFGYGVDRPTYRAGETIHLMLYYRRLNEVELNYTVFTQLWGPENPTTGGVVWAQDDSEPCRRGYPTLAWGEKEIVVDTYRLPIPGDAPSGNYDLATGFYQWQTLERLPIVDATGQIVDDTAAILGQVEVAGQ